MGQKYIFGEKVAERFDIGTLLALNNPKEDGLHTKNPSRFAKGFFVFRRLEAPQSLRDSSLKEGASGETASFVVCPETLPYCQSLPYEGGGKPDRA